MQVSFNGNTDVLYSTKFLQLKQTKSPDGKFNWFYAHRTNTKPNQDNAVIITPVIHEPNGDSILFIESKRPPIAAEGKAETCIELPAGLIGDIRENETATDAVKAELLEETGLEADSIEISVKNSASSGGCVSETVTYARADISNPIEIQQPIDDNGVIVARHKVPVKDVSNWLKAQAKEGKSITSMTLAALYCSQAFHCVK